MLADILKSISLQQKPLPSVLPQLGMQANMYFTVTSIKCNAQVMHLAFFFFFLKPQIGEAVSLQAVEFPRMKNGIFKTKSTIHAGIMQGILFLKPGEISRIKVP